MRTPLAIGLLVTACTTTPADDTAAIEQAIIGGELADPTEFPSVVALEEAPGQWFCTGTLIDPEWILTAAHCVQGSTPGKVNIRFGDADANDAAGGTVVAARAIFAHDWDGEAWDNDIALVRLVRPITDRAATPIYRDPTPMATRVVDVGYGVADNMDGGGGLLRKVEKVTADCAGTGDPAISNANIICMNADDGRGSCFGDSGGPTFATMNGSRVVVGVTSGGTGELCGAGWDIYTSVHGELAFIDAAMSGQVMPDTGEPPDEPAGGDDTAPPVTDDTGGCNAVGGQAGLALGLLALARRRRRHRR